MFANLSAVIGNVRAGQLRALAVTGLQRAAAAPEIPTVAEQGLPGFEDVTWNALMAPAGTPPDIVGRLRAAVATAVAQPELRKRFLERAIELQASSSSEEFGGYLKSEVESFARLAREANLKTE